jgi:acetate kinase
MSLLTLNAGSSSIRFALHEAGDPRARRLEGRLERIGGASPAVLIVEPDGCGQQQRIDAGVLDFAAAAVFVLDWLKTHAAREPLIAIGHRVVHGMQRTSPERIAEPLLRALEDIVPFDPEHLPCEIALMRAAHRQWPEVPQVACFDTAFHRTMPAVAMQLPLPRRYQAQGVQRYGFHGLSYTYLIEELARLGDDSARSGRVVLAHLGNGASLAAVRAGRSIDTSMSFTPTGGIPMSTRSGDLDPGIVSFLMRLEHIDAAGLERLVTRESGLLGLSETSADVRDLLEREPGDPRAAEALELFCYQTRKCIGAFAAALGGLDTLVFAGGIGENAASVRARICTELAFLGLELDAGCNAAHSPIISSTASRVRVRVIRTDEASVIARETMRLLGLLNASAREP